MINAEGPVLSYGAVGSPVGAQRIPFLKASAPWHPSVWPPECFRQSCNAQGKAARRSIWLQHPKALLIGRPLRWAVKEK